MYHKGLRVHGAPGLVRIGRGVAQKELEEISRSEASKRSFQEELKAGKESSMHVT